MKRIVLLAAGALGAAGLITMAAPASAAPATATTNDTSVGCAPAFLCQVRDRITVQSEQFVQGIADQPRQFLHGGVVDGVDHPGLLNQRDHFVSSVKDFFTAGNED